MLAGICVAPKSRYGEQPSGKAKEKRPVVKSWPQQINFVQQTTNKQMFYFRWLCFDLDILVIFSSMAWQRQPMSAPCFGASEDGLCWASGPSAEIHEHPSHGFSIGISIGFFRNETK